jgi:hypothetical protein
MIMECIYFCNEKWLRSVACLVMYSLALEVLEERGKLIMVIYINFITLLYLFFFFQLKMNLFYVFCFTFWSNVCILWKGGTCHRKVMARRQSLMFGFCRG